MTSLVKSEVKASELTIATPVDTTCSADILDVAFHPTQNVFAVGLITGAVELYHYIQGQISTRVLHLSHHSVSCRTINFSPSGQTLYTSSLDKSVCVVNSCGKVTWSACDAHGILNVSSIEPIDVNVFATGDEGGRIKIWDVRQRVSIAELSAQEDYVAAMTVGDSQSLLFSASGDGTLATYNLKQRKLFWKSACMEDELLSVEVMKNERKIVTGSQSGVINIWECEKSDDCLPERFVGHPESIQSLVKVDEHTLLTGSSDGLIRIISLHPNKLVGVIGEHEEGFPVEKITRSHDDALLASISHDSTVKFWDLSCFIDDYDADVKSIGEMSVNGVSLADLKDGVVSTSLSTPSNSTGPSVSASTVVEKKDSTLWTQNAQQEFFADL
jgi:WD repeat-containing protein 55